MTPPVSAAVPVIRPRGVYRLGQLRQLLGLPESTLRAERRAGRLRVGKRGNGFYVLGRWVWEWLEGGQLPLPGQAPKE